MGAAAASDQLPLPLVIDIKVDRSSGLTAEKIVRILEPRIAGVAVDDHSHWLSGFVNALRSTELVALAIVILIGLATMATIIFTTRTGMELHRQTIEVMHFVGAKDAYIARQFAVRAFKLGMGGSIIGIVCAVPTLLLMAFLIGNLDSGLIPEMHLSHVGWISIALLIPATAVLAMATARQTVTKSLSKLV